MTMRRHLMFAVSVISLAAVCSAQDEEQAEEQVQYNRVRYDVIVARQPFGVEPLVDNATANDPQQKQLERELRLCFLMESQSGEVRAGFQNLKAKKGDPKSVILMEGESYRAMKLVKIDLENSTATLEYGGKDMTFELSKGKGAAAAAAKPQTPAVQQSRPERRFGGGFRRTTPPPEETQPAPTQPEAPQLSEEELVRQREEVRATLQEYQMEVIRQGMPPLPIQLTPEQDDQLVAEGILEPIEE